MFSIVPTLRVVTRFVPLLRHGTRSVPLRHYHAERGNDA